MVTCPKCESVLRDGTQFCPVCSTALAANEAPQKTAPVQINPVTNQPIIKDYYCYQQPNPPQPVEVLQNSEHQDNPQ